MTKLEAYQEAQTLGAAFVANVVMNWHREPARKLKGLVNLLKAGHSVQTAQTAIDVLLIDGVKASWCVLDEWSNRHA